MQLKLEGIDKHFGKAQVLDRIQLEARSGELLALLGPSGSGKTTLLRIVGGLEQPSAGRVLYGNDDTSGWPIQQRRVGFVFQNYALFRHMSVFENVAFGLRAQARKVRPNETQIRARVHELLSLVRLEGTHTRYPTQLSGGQQQRVALARALAIEPRVLLLDEPFGALDAQVRKELRRWVRQIHDRTGLTTLFVTHDQDEALELADRIAIMHAGKLAQVGTPDEIFDEPATRFVHEFVGESSALPVDVDAGRVWFEGRALDLISRHDLSGAADLLFRPQHVALVDADSSAIPARVLGVVRVGARFRIETEVGKAATRVEIESNVKPDAARGAILHFKPLRWKLYRRANPGPIGSTALAVGTPSIDGENSPQYNAVAGVA